MLISFSKFCCRKEAWGYAKVIHKKKELRKNNAFLAYKLHNLFSSKCFQVSKERYVFKEQRRIRLAAIHISTHMHILV